MKKYLITLLIWLFPVVCLAAPSISNVTGTFNNGSPDVIIYGSNFGTHSLDIYPLISNIENGSVGGTLTGASRWGTPSDGSNTYAVRYTDTQKHSGNKSLYGHWVMPADHWISYIYYNNDTTLLHGDPIYITYWVRFSYSGASGQWKWFRLRPDTSVGDISPEIMASSWPTGERYMLNKPNSYATSTWTTASGEQANSRGGIYFTSSPYSSADTPSTTGAWRRVEFYVDPSTQGGTDGAFQYYIHNPGTGIRNPLSFTTLMNYGASQTGRYKAAIIGHYWGNTGTSSTAEFWIDDAYVQTGTQARIELGNAATWGACTWREIQVPTAWASGQATITLNTGQFSTGNHAYLYIVDSSGAYNTTGYDITIGESGGSDIPPAILSGPLPTGVQTCTTDPRNVTLQVTTNENAMVKYDTSDVAYDSMANTFSTTGELSHSTVVSNACGASYTYYVRSMDAAGNKNTSSTAISYSVEAAPEEDTVLPTVTITSPADDPHEDTTQYVTVSGTSSAHGVKTISTVTASGPTFQTVGVVTGTTSWSVPVVISQGTFSSDLLYGGGAFTSTGSWTVGTNWTIGSGVASNSGTATNCWLGMNFASEIGKTYRVTYTVSGTPSGTLVLSQWGFGGVTQTLDSSAGTHTVDVVATRANSDLAFVANPWVGTLDNVTVKKIQYDTLTITATDNLGYTNTDTIQMGYTAPETVAPRKVLGLGVNTRIDLGDGKILEF